MLLRMAAVGFAAGVSGTAVELATWQVLGTGALADAGVDLVAGLITAMLVLTLGLLALRTLPTVGETAMVVLAVGASDIAANFAADGLASISLILDDLGWVILNGVAMSAVFLIGLWFVRDANANLRRSAASSA
jgi:hypothetical protein